jgi:hypothetical protein
LNWLGGAVVTLDTAPTPVDTEEFWEDLLLDIRHKRVIPILGAELLTIVDNEHVVPLYRVVAERLLKKYQSSMPTLPGGEVLRQGHELNDAVCALASAGKRIKDLYPRIDEILEGLLAEQKEAQQSLREIASIRDFDLFVTTTPDNLLVQALNAVRFDGADVTHEIEYAPNLPDDRERDIPEIIGPNYAAVFYLFGKADVGPFYAIHDEDALEFPYMLQRKGRPEQIFGELQGRDLLLLGCTFHDWLSRFFIRLTNSMRLSVDRDKKEFLVGEETAGNQSLTGFLKRFSHDSHCYQGDARTFVAELYKRWTAVVPREPSVAARQVSPTGGIEPASFRGSIFISYAHEDVVAARTLFTELETIGSDVAWFDKTDLKPGDIWDSQITDAIDRCRLFLPLLSAATEQRDEGYFKREWNRAADRSKSFIGRKFIFPIVIDPDYTGDMSRYALVPPVFKELQYNHAPTGHMKDVLREELTNQLRILRRAKVV